MIFDLFFAYTLKVPSRQEGRASECDIFMFGHFYIRTCYTQKGIFFCLGSFSKPKDYCGCSAGIVEISNGRFFNPFDRRAY